MSVRWYAVLRDQILSCQHVFYYTGNGKSLLLGVQLHKRFHTASLLTLPSNIRLVRKWLTVSNSLAYYDTELITAVKSLSVQAPVITIVLDVAKFAK